MVAALSVWLVLALCTPMPGVLRQVVEQGSYGWVALSLRVRGCLLVLMVDVLDALVQLADVVSLLFLGLARANALALNDTGECPLVWLIYLKRVPVNDHLRLPVLLIVRAV